MFTLPQPQMPQILRYQVNAGDKGVLPSAVKYVQTINGSTTTPTVTGDRNANFIIVDDMIPISAGGPGLSENSYFWDGANETLYYILSTGGINDPATDPSQTQFTLQVTPPIEESFSSIEFTVIESVPELYIIAEGYDINNTRGAKIVLKDETGKEDSYPFAAGVSGATNQAASAVMSNKQANGQCIPIVMDMSEAYQPAIAYNVPITA